MKAPSPYATKPRPTLEPARLYFKYTRARYALAIALTVLYLLWHISGLGRTSTSHILPTFNQSTPPLPCRNLPGVNETLVVIRTGSTELVNRLTSHLSTTIRCFPNYLVFSDIEETYHGEHVFDALEDVSSNILENNPDFELHRRLRTGGRAALNSTELAGSPDKYASKTGKTENPGWKLDKWKFLPMINKTLNERPDMKWYVFTEADGFILGSMLQQYLATLDSTKPIYAGRPVQIGEDVFAHGGSGFVVSQPALQMAVKYYTAHKAEIEEFTDHHWAGDCVLGKTLADSGVPLTHAWPAFQSDYPGLVEYSQVDSRPQGDRLRVWCTTPVSYHHMSAAQVEEMWNYEQDWIARHNPVTDTLRHRDVFNDLIMPQMMAPRSGWENLSDHEEGTFGSVDECRELCVARRECRQYSFDQDGVCRTNVEPRLGRAEQGVMSGWVEDRIREYQHGMEPCGNEGWPF